MSAVSDSWVLAKLDELESSLMDEIRDRDDTIESLRSDLEGQIERNESLIYESINEHERNYDHDTI